MKVARIIATFEAHPLRSMLEQSLASAGWSIAPNVDGDEPRSQLVLTLDISLEAFATACNRTAADGRTGGAGLAVHIASEQAPAMSPKALPAPAPVRDSEIRALALASAPHLRVNAITVASSDDASALAGEILAAVMLFVECPAMTGVVIGIDRPIGVQADQQPSGQQQGESRS